MISMLHLVSFIQFQFQCNLDSPNFDSNLNQPVNIRKLIICFRQFVVCLYNHLPDQITMCILGKNDCTSNALKVLETTHQVPFHMNTFYQFSRYILIKISSTEQNISECLNSRFLYIYSLDLCFRMYKRQTKHSSFLAVNV